MLQDITIVILLQVTHFKKSGDPTKSKKKKELKEKKIKE